MVHSYLHYFLRLWVCGRQQFTKFHRQKWCTKPIFMCALTKASNIYRPQRSCGQGNIFTPVCHSVHRGGGGVVCLVRGVSHKALRQTPPWTRHTIPPRPGTHTPHPRPVTKPPDQTPHTPPGLDTPRPDTHPPDQTPPPSREADSGIRSSSGRYASYWNAFLYVDMNTP